MVLTAGGDAASMRPEGTGRWRGAPHPDGRTLLATHTSGQIVAKLNAAGLLTGKGKPLTPGGVARFRDAYTAASCGRVLREQLDQIAVPS